ncbi:hypothetical protein LEP1GSC123_0923 [Leptospira borgpetersenii str. 200701203]|uniref:Uncharacterized protein n=1 Tax=Leptospira borgpetersenii str. 200701203 TaxID=1193007 RepID=M3HJD4_LEPBO|nr:hypothetical protein LEP1GSC123_0923 [Leptospira borgpetersenii str. 200701203]
MVPETGEILNSTERFPDPRRAKFEDRSFPKTAFYYLKFLEPTYVQKINDLGHYYLSERQKHFWIPCSWWTNFLKTSEGQSIGLPKNESGLENIDNWLKTQASGAAYLLTEFYGEEYLDEFLKNGKEKFEKNKKYQTILKDEREKRENEIQTRFNEVPF